MNMQNNSDFRFDISLTVLNHLGRNLYRNFITVLGEAISNAWDADATNVWISIDTENNNFIIEDDGIGMSESDFRDKFLKIGYSKRGTDNENTHSTKRRPYIGRKGIGKLALLSCAQTIKIISKTATTSKIGGIIDNKKLDAAIEKDLPTDGYILETINPDDHNLRSDNGHGTIIQFENFNNGVQNSIGHLRKLIALYFKFSLLDELFNIFLDDKKITAADLKDLAEKTEFLWNINESHDLFLTALKSLKETESIQKSNKIKGFIASVNKPSQLNILGLGAKIGVDIFVNGRLRETNILKHMKGFSTQHVASYLYGQIHFNELDDGDDRFTSDREGIKVDDEKYQEFLVLSEKILQKISNEWDDWRRKHKQDGDPENLKIALYQRKLEESGNHRKKNFDKKIDETEIDETVKDTLKKQIKELSSKNINIYQDLFILENIFREFLKSKGINSLNDISKKFETDEDEDIKKCVKNLTRIKNDREEDEERHELKGRIVKNEHDLNYADLVWLGMIVDKVQKNRTGRYTPQTLESDTKSITPIRNAIMHTNEITDDVEKWEKIKNVINYIDNLASSKPDNKQ